jgi:hypothetical protein
LTGINITKWHTYTIIWTNEKADFMVDGEVVATTSSPPKATMGVALRIGDDHYHPPSGILGTYLEELIPPGSGWRSGDADVSVNDGIEVDYVHLWTSEERLTEMLSTAHKVLGEVDALLPEIRRLSLDAMYGMATEAWVNQHYFTAWACASEVITECEAPELFYIAEDALRVMEGSGWNISKAKEAYERVLSPWVSAEPSHAPVYTGFFQGCILGPSWTRLRGIVAWRDILRTDLFARAWESIQGARQRGEDTLLMEYFFSRAEDQLRVAQTREKEWFPAGNYLEAKTYLDMIPEPTLLLILVLILLPAHLRRVKS